MGKSSARTSSRVAILQFLLCFNLQVFFNQSPKIIQSSARHRHVTLQSNPPHRVVMYGEALVVTENVFAPNCSITY